MGSDRARVSYDPHQQYRSVVMQQGRVTVEADWNEAQQISGEELRNETRDIVGPSGTPDDGYKVDPARGANIPPFDFFVQAGAMYVGGMRAVLPRPVEYSNQPDWLDYSDDPDWVDLPTFDGKLPGNEFVYLLLREQEVSAVEDPDLKDIALGGPDTAQRTRLLQHFVRIASPGADCASGLAAAEVAWRAQGLHFDPNTMRLNSWGQLQVSFSDLTSNGPCEPPAVGGYVAPDNQLIRVQLSGDDPATGKPQFLWGFDDASFLYRVDVDPNNPQNLIFESAPVDNYRQPVAGQAVEILRPAAELPNGALVAAASGFVVTLDQNYQPGTQSITLPVGIDLPPEYLGAGQSPSGPLFLRVWQEVTPLASGIATPLGDTGVLVTIETVKGRPFHRGDFWRFAVRPATPQQVYPERYQNGLQFPDGPREWACPLGVISWLKDIGTLASDCRNFFDNLVDLTRRWQGCCPITVRPSDLTSTTLQSIVDQAANPTMFVSAATAGSAGNNIAISISSLNLNSIPATFDLTVTETDVYPGLTTGTIEGILGDEEGAGTRPGLAQILTGSVKNLPQDQEAFLSGGTANKNAQANLTDAAGQLAFTLFAKSSGTDGNLTTATISNAGQASAASFDLTLVWTKTLTGLNLGSFLQQTQSGLAYEITATAPAGYKPSFPAEGVATLSGGVDGNAANGTAAVAASAYVFGNPSRICLRPGSYVLPRPLIIHAVQSNLTIEGCGGGVTLSGDSKSAAGFVAGLIEILDARNVTLRGLTLALAANSLFDQGFTLGGLKQTEFDSFGETSLARTETSIGIRIVGCQGVTIEDCNFRYPILGLTGTTQLFAGIYANADCAEIRVENNCFLGPANLLAAAESGPEETLVFGYVQASTAGFSSLNANASAFSGTVVPSTADDLTFRGNRFENLAFAVLLEVPVGFLKFVSNRVDSCLTGFAILDLGYFYNAALVSENFPDKATQQIAKQFFSSAMIQNSLAVPAAIPLPPEYRPVRTLMVTKTAAAPVKSNTLLEAGNLQPFALRILQFEALDSPGFNEVAFGPPVATLSTRLHVAGNDINVLPNKQGYAIFIGVAGTLNGKTTVTGLITMTGNTLLSQSAMATVLLDGVARCAIAGNVVVNSFPVNSSNPSVYSLVIEPRVLGVAGAVTGNVLLGLVILPPRSGTNPVWDTYNDVRP